MAYALYYARHLGAQAGFASASIGSEVPAEMERFKVVRRPRPS